MSLMTSETLVELLTKQAGARKEGSAYVLPVDSETTIYVSLEGETLAVGRVSRVEIMSGLAICDTRGERTCVAVEDVRAVRVARPTEAGGRDGGAGFVRR